MIAPVNGVARHESRAIKGFKWVSEGSEHDIRYELDVVVGYNLTLDEDRKRKRVWVTCDEVVEHVDCVSVSITRGNHEIAKFSRSSGVDQAILESFARDFMEGGKNDGSHDEILERFQKDIEVPSLSEMRQQSLVSV